MTRKTITRVIERKIGDLVLAHCHHVDGSDEFCEYEEGWDDQKIATDLVGDGVALVHVRSIRSELVGKLRPFRKPLPTTPDTRIDTLVDRLNRLLDTLSVNKVLDVRYLKINGDLLDTPSK